MRLCVGLLLLASLGTVACKGAPKIPCQGINMSSAIVQNTQLFKIDIYGAEATCQGRQVMSSSAPQSTQSYPKGTAISLKVPPGQHAIMLTAYSDSAGTQILAQACVAAKIEPGSEVCFDLEILPLDGGVDFPPVDAALDATQLDLTSSDSSSTDLTMPADLTPPPDFAAVDQAGIDMTCAGKFCGQTCVAANQCCNSAECTNFPVPTACYNGTCANVGALCSYQLKSGSVTCGNTCCNAISGTCNGNCTLTCNAGRGDCNGVRSDGCELITNTTTNCSACGVTCDSNNSNGASCNGASCTYSSCKANRWDCNSAAPDSNGCECEGTGCCSTSCQTKHNNGASGFYYDCVPLSTFNSTQASKAANSWGIGSSTETFCGDSQCLQVDQGNPCGVWCYNGSRAGKVKIDFSCTCPEEFESTSWN